MTNNMSRQIFKLISHFIFQYKLSLYPCETRTARNGMYFILTCFALAAVFPSK